MRNLFVAGAIVCIGGLAGCAGPLPRTVPVALAGQSQATVKLEAVQEGSFAVHGLDMQPDGEGFVITGHVGPAVRSGYGPEGHVDVEVTAPDGRRLTGASANLDAASVSPRAVVERRFRVILPEPPPAGSTVTVRYHSAEGLHYAEK